jgi:hypothetical protein
MESWETITIIAVLLSFAISGIMIMFSRLFQLPALEQWAKAEMVFSLSTVILVICIFVLVFAIQPVLVSTVQQITEQNFAASTGPAMIPQGADLTLMDFALAYMQSIFDCIRSILKLMMKISFPAELAASFNTDAFMFDLVTGWAFKSVVQTIRNISNYMTFTLFIYYLFVHIMRFIEATALTIFLPLGIVLRQFPPTRGSGAFIIAFALGFYFIFPFSYIIAVNIAPQTMACPIIPDFSNIPGSCGSANPDSAFAATLWLESSSNGILSFLSSLGTYISEVSLDPFGVIPDALEFTGGRLTGFAINLCCLPFLAMVITMSFILSTTNLFGANLPEIGRGFVKLI